MRSIAHLGQELHGGRGEGMSSRKSVQKQLDSLLLRLQPTAAADERRRVVFEYVKEVVQQAVPGSKIFSVGSFPLKTYLPYADVDMVMFSPRGIISTGRGGDRSSVVAVGAPGEGGGRSQRPGGIADGISVADAEEAAVASQPPALVAVNQALCMMAACAGARGGAAAHSRPWRPLFDPSKPQIRNVSFINARTPIVTMVVGNVVVDLTENQAGSVAALALLEEADNLIKRDHLFKRSLLLLKVWAWCETPRLVGKRVLGAQCGGLTSYGLAVMVLHLFAFEASADSLKHPLDVFVRFFEVYSEFDWRRYCLTLDGPVPFESPRSPRPLARSQGEGGKASRLQPLVRKVMAELSPALEKNQERKEEQEGGGARHRERRAGFQGRSSDASGASSANAKEMGSADAAPHFPKRSCNIQDPLNMLNNLGHSVTRSNLAALERALRHGRQQLDAWQLLSRASRPHSSRSDSPARRGTEGQAVQPSISRGVRSVEGSGGTGRWEKGPGAEEEDHRTLSWEHAPDPSPHPAAQITEQFNSIPRPPLHFAPAQYASVPPLEAACPGANRNVVRPQPVLVSGAYPAAGGGGQPFAFAFRQHGLHGLHTVPHHIHARQPQLYMVQQGQGQPMMLRAHSAVLVPAHALQAHPGSRPPWQLQRVASVPYLGAGQLDQQPYATANGPPLDSKNQVTTNVEVRSDEPEAETRYGAGPRAEEARRCSPSEKENPRGGQQMRKENAHDADAMRDPVLPWDYSAFVNGSPTSSTASLSDCVDDGHDGQLHYESGAEDDGHGMQTKENLVVLSLGRTRHSDAIVDARVQERNAACGAGATLNGSLSANLFLREFFPECCRRYGYGDGFREDLLDHPCQPWSKLREPGSPPPRRPDAPDVLRGSAQDVWKSLKTVGEVMREVGRQTNGLGDLGTEPGAAIAPLKAQARRADTDAPSSAVGGGTPQSKNAGDTASEMDLLQPCRRPDEGASGSRPQRGAGAGSGSKIATQVPIGEKPECSTSVQQKGREDPAPPSSPGSRRGSSTSFAKVSAVFSASTQTSDFEAARKVGAGTASASETSTRISISAGVQCRLPALDITTRASVGVQCVLLFDEGAGEATPDATTSPTSTRTGADGGGNVTSISGGEREGGYDTPGNGTRALPSPPPPGEPVQPAPVTSLIESSAGVFLEGVGAVPKSKKKRKKSRPTGLIASPAAAEDAVDTSSERLSSAVMSSVRVGHWRSRYLRYWLVRRVLFCGVACFVLAAAGGRVFGRLEQARGQGGDLPVRGGAHEGQKYAARPPLWVTVGGSLTLGDVLASRFPASQNVSAGRVQWFKDGRALPEQSRPFLTIVMASLEDEGTYACFSVEESGRIGSRALWEETTVRIIEPPVVESKLQTLRLALGEMLTIIATASGVPQPEYQWRLNGVPIPGASGPMLVRHSVSDADMGTYTCDVSNIAGSVQWEEMAVVLRTDGPKRHR